MSGNKYRRLIGYGLRQWPTLLLILGLTIAVSAAAALQPWPMKLLVDHALGQAPAPAPLLSLFRALSLGPSPAVLIVAAALGSLGLFALNSAFDLWLGRAWAGAGQRMIYDLSADLFHRLQRRSLLFHSRRAVGDSLSRLTGDTWCVYGITGSLLISPVQHLFTLATISVVAWKLDAGLTALSLTAAPLLAGSALFFGRRLKQRTRQDREANSRLFSFVHQTLTAVPVVQAFCAEERNSLRFKQLASDAVRHSQRVARLGNTQGLVNGVTTTVANAFILFFGGRRVLSGEITVGSLLVFLAYFRSMQGSLQGLMSIYVQLKSAEASVDRVTEDLAADDEVPEATDARPLPARPAGERGHVRLEGVTFGYEPGRPVIEGVTVEARPGETLAVVGPTGAGKSTLVGLIPRFFDPWDGRITIDGIDIRSVKLSSLRSQISIVLQEPILLPLTVAENIAYGRPGASRAEMVEAAEAANADGFIRRLPLGYDTIIGERGATLSGGERQRLAIARALLKDAPILILDEPTSALDAQTEWQLLEALERLMKGRTTFIIAHRLSTIRRADQIVELVDGRVTGTGTHEELLACEGLYASHHALQTLASAEGVLT